MRERTNATEARTEWYLVSQHQREQEFLLQCKDDMFVEAKDEFNLPIHLGRKNEKRENVFDYNQKKHSNSQDQIEVIS